MGVSRSAPAPARGCGGPRRRAGCCAAFAGLLSVLVPAAAQQPEIPPEELERAEMLREDMRRLMNLARDRVFPALVNISVITVQYWDGKERKGRAVGSGTIISPEGYVLTNYHVAQNGKKFKVTLSDKREVTADLVGEDPLTDLAVLRIRREELPEPDAPLPFARFGDSDELEIGDTVMAMGSPWALSRSVTRGSISNTERILSSSEDEAEELRFDRDQRTGIFNRWIQHDAAISPGNSGGPLVNLKGEVVGVNARGGIIGGDMGFAIPSNVCRQVAALLIEHGEVPRSWYGITLKSIKKSGLKAGVLVNSVDLDGPAHKAGLSAGDVILRIDGQPVTVIYPEQIPPLLRELADRPVGSVVCFDIMRDGQPLTVQVTTEKLKRDRGEEAAFRAWGLTAQEITENMARDRRLGSTEGVLISGVRPGSPAALAEPPLHDGDVIRAIDGQPIRTHAEFVAFYEQLMNRQALPEYVLVEFDRRGKSHITLLKPRPDKEEDPPREVAKAWIGIDTQPVLRNLAEQLGRPDALGFRVTRVYPRTLAAETELRVGDIITALNGEKLRPRGMQDAGMFQRKVRELDISDKAVLTVVREGGTLEITVPLERTRLTPEEARRDRNRDFELVVRELTFFDRDENRWDESVNGVLVISVEPAGWAGLGGIRTGDLIRRIGDVEITDLDTYRRTIEQITEEKPSRIVFVVLRGVRTHFQYVEPDWSPESVAEPEDEAAAEPPGQ